VALVPVFARVAVERLARLAERLDQRREQASARGQDVLDVRRAPAEVASLDECIALHVAQAIHERAAADGV
jgi:CRP-like cAMP-binding protein